MAISANEKTIYWQSMLEKWKYSGLSQQAFSSLEGIDVKRLIYWKRALIDRGLFTDRVSVSKVAKSKELADKNPEEPKLLPVNIMATDNRIRADEAGRAARIFCLGFRGLLLCLTGLLLC